MVQAWWENTPAQYEGICFLYVKFFLYTQPWAIRLGVKIITLSKTKICIPITFIWELPPLSGADTERDGNKLHVHVAGVDGWRNHSFGGCIDCCYGQRHKNEWQKRMKNIKNEKSKDYCKADLKQRVLFLITIFRLAIPNYCYKKQYTLF